jgi:hypothetical protein
VKSEGSVGGRWLDYGSSGADVLGIEPVWLVITAQGQMFDFRYRVVDAEKAKLILNRSIKRMGLVNETTGRGVGVFQGIGKLSKSRRTTFAPGVGRVYSTLFINAGIFRPGDRAPLKVEHVDAPGVVVQ